MYKTVRAAYNLRNRMMVIEPDGYIHHGEKAASPLFLAINFDRNSRSKNSKNHCKEGETSDNWCKPMLTFRVVIDSITEIRVDIPLNEFCSRLGIDYRNLMLSINPRDHTENEESNEEAIPQPVNFAEKMSQFLKHPYENTWALAYRYAMDTLEKMGYERGMDRLRIIENWYGPTELHHRPTTEKIEDFELCSCFKEILKNGLDTNKPPVKSDGSPSEG
jgi:hypothetical protein